MVDASQTVLTEFLDYQGKVLPERYPCLQPMEPNEQDKWRRLTGLPDQRLLHSILCTAIEGNSLFY